jgi:hypothetical protein
VKLATEAVRFVKELYPRLDPDDAAIERYRAALDRLPPITVARDGLLVDGYHRWQAHRREGSLEVEIENLGNLTDLEIRKESLRRNSSHGRQLETKDKRKQAGEMYLLGVDESELRDLLSITASTLETYLRDAKREEKQRQQERAWDLWLDCLSERQIAERIGVVQKTINNWVSNYRTDPRFTQPPESRQHFDVWQFGTDGGDSSYFGRMPPQVVENLLWLWTEPGQIVVDPFAGSGTTIRVCKQVGRRVWASDRRGAFWDETLPIHTHDITTGWPAGAPAKADLIILDPPYWQQAKGRYSDDPADLGNMELWEFGDAWQKTLKACAEHLAEDGHLAFIISPTQLENGNVIDHATIMAGDAIMAGFAEERRIIVPYSTQQATGQQVTWAREHRRLLKLYRDLVVLSVR